MNQSAGTPSEPRGAVPAVRAARGRELALRSLQALLALFYVFASALPKLIAHASATEGFEQIGFGMWFMYAIGVLELAGGIALVVPRLSGLSALALIALMAGAFITQVTVFDGRNAYTPLLLMVPLGVIAWVRRGTVTALAARLRGTA
ncbi:DoxX-like family protein [Streptomyces sp. WMMB 714]|uniref:DoxX family protein n=1 Tax=Streptomyces sp. WMMB 714 TaxID=1286822 RepID=UPI0005F7EE6D|nr:DoxX family protein [Streptomyces sp. WMMB 714]SCK05709.1 DoxX-like family protein [Streptomyces sp. WMMB 714]